MDTTPPSVTCPADITRVIELGDGGINVEWDLPSGTDLSEPVTIVSTTRQPGSFFTVGQTEITYVLTDAASNQNSCNFVVTVTTSEFLDFFLSFYVKFVLAQKPQPVIRLKTCTGQAVWYKSALCT